MVEESCRNEEKWELRACILLWIWHVASNWPKNNILNYNKPNFLQHNISGPRNVQRKTLWHKQEACYVHLVIAWNRKEHFVLRLCSWKKKNAKSLHSGAVCPCQPKRKSTDYKPAEHIHSDIKCILKFCLFSRGNYSVSPAWSARPTTGTEQDQLPCGSTGTSSGNCQERKTCMVRACHTPWQPLKNILQSIMNCGRRRGRQSKCWMDNMKE